MIVFQPGGFKIFSEKFPQFCVKPQSPASQMSSCPRPLCPPTPRPEEYDKEPVEIFDFLLVGSQDVASNMETLDRYGITYILNAARECQDAFVGNSKFRYKRLDLLDCASQDLNLELYEEAFLFIDEAVDRGAKILVHCRAGQSRSATIVISYIMRTYRWSLQRAYHFVQGKRPSVSPNLGFISQLIQFEARVLGQSTNIQSLLGYDSVSAPITPPYERNVVPLNGMITVDCK